MDRSETMKILKKETFLSEGQTCECLGILESGSMRSYLIKDSEEYISDFYFPASIVCSYRSFLTGDKSPGYIETIEDSEIKVISKKNFDDLTTSSTDGYRWARYIAETLFIKKCRKETSLLMQSAKERYDLLLATYPKIEQRVSQYHIASYLGIKPESLSRLKRLNLG